MTSMICVFSFGGISTAFLLPMINIDGDGTDMAVARE